MIQCDILSRGQPDFFIMEANDVGSPGMCQALLPKQATYPSAKCQGRKEVALQSAYIISGNSNRPVRIYSSSSIIFLSSDFIIHLLLPSNLLQKFNNIHVQK